MQKTLVSCCTAIRKMLRNEALKSSLMSSSHLSTYVDSISILIDPEVCCNISFVVLGKLNRLRSLKIEGTSQWGAWSDLPDIYKHNISTVLRFPTLRYFRLSYMHKFPISYLCAFPSLRKLEPRHMTLLDDIVFDFTDHPPSLIDPNREGSLQTLIAREYAIHSLYPALLSPL
ncbi:hypothetical protein FPV67DRAFT_1489786 [Lyophyllum atratum]|nr:hypothetical protein FPV67DRAFT_1489786 [Lyophyllum atratum]